MKGSQSHKESKCFSILNLLFAVRLGCIYLEVVSEVRKLQMARTFSLFALIQYLSAQTHHWRNSTFFPQFGSNPMLQHGFAWNMNG
ncbi:unnamed protein product, partial [Vitis vinifera]